MKFKVGDPVIFWQNPVYFGTVIEIMNNGYIVEYGAGYIGARKVCYSRRIAESIFDFDLDRDFKENCKIIKSLLGVENE